MIAIDRSSHSETAVDVALDLAGEDARYVLVNVVEMISTPGTAFAPLHSEGPDVELLEEVRKGAQAYLDELAQRLSERGIQAEGRAVLGEDAATEILDEAARDTADLLAMTTHGEGGFRRLLLGSVTDQVIRGSDRPVLVFRPPA